jgi:hypothetical protein
MNSLELRNPRDAECGDNLVNGDEMRSEPQSKSRDGEATTARSRLALFVVAELLCTGAFVTLLVLYM